MKQSVHSPLTMDNVIIYIAWGPIAGYIHICSKCLCVVKEQVEQPKRFYGTSYRYRCAIMPPTEHSYMIHVCNLESWHLFGYLRAWSLSSLLAVAAEWS